MSTMSNDTVAPFGESPASRRDPAGASRARKIGYWVCTLYLASTSVGAGIVDVLLLHPAREALVHLGYPPHFGVLLGVWKVLGAVVLVAPRSALFKEWAYAGFFIDFSAAVVAHASAGDGAKALVGPVLSIAFLVASWALRPDARRLVTTSP
jgi:hypothetical protein